MEVVIMLMTYLWEYINVKVFNLITNIKLEEKY